jgi:hypothetical protein
MSLSDWKRSGIGRTRKTLNHEGYKGSLWRTYADASARREAGERLGRCIYGLNDRTQAGELPRLLPLAKN